MSHGTGQEFLFSCLFIIFYTQALISANIINGDETWTLREVDQKCLKSFEMWCWRRMEISWTDRVRNEEMLHRAKEQRNILHTTKRREARWIGDVLRSNCYLKHVIEGKIQVTARWGRGRKQLLDNINPLNAELNPICYLLALLGAHPIFHVSRIRVKETRRYCGLKEDALDRSLRRTGFGRGYGPDVSQNTVCMYVCMYYYYYCKVLYLEHSFVWC
jgi:hypothetical protein